MIFMIFSVTSFGIYFWWIVASILAPFWDPFDIKIHFGGGDQYLLKYFLNWFVIDFAPNRLLKVGGWYRPVSVLFVTCFRTVVPFAMVSPTSARNHVFELFIYFSKKVKECIHACTFYLRKTYKCAVTVITILKKKKLNVKNLKFRTLQGVMLEQLLRRLAPFWSALGSIWVVLVLLLGPFWICCGPFSVSLARFWFPNPLKHFLKHFQQSTLRKK